MKRLDIDSIETTAVQVVPAWMQRMRDAAQKLLTPEVIEEIVGDQIRRARSGDQKAIRFVLDYLAGGQSFKGATFIQNNNYGDGAAATKPTKALPGSDAKIRAMQKRAAAGLPLAQADDGPPETED